jgi:hypothetical protein
MLLSCCAKTLLSRIIGCLSHIISGVDERNLTETHSCSVLDEEMINFDFRVGLTVRDMTCGYSSHVL